MLNTAVSVKGRNFPYSETKSTHFDTHNIEMLEDFAKSFNMIPAVAFVFIDNMEFVHKLRIFIIKLNTLRQRANDSRIKYVTNSKMVDIFLMNR